MKDKSKYKEGTVNGMKFDSEKKKRVRVVSTKTLIKISILCVVILIAFLIFYWVIKKNVSYNGIYYETPKEDEVIEVVVDPESEDQQEQVNLKLKGELVIELEAGEKWEDPGFVATSDVAGDISDYVKVSGKVDTEKKGTYEIVYELDYKVIAPKLTRLVNVVEKESNGDNNDNNSENSSNGSNSTGSGGNSTGGNSSLGSSVVTPKPSTITLSLVGDDTVYLVTGSTYYDLGASAVDNLGNNVSSKITQSGSVNTNVAGTYKITYSINNYNGQVLTVVRNVVVQSMNISLSSSVNGSKAVIKVVTNVDNFSYILLPNGSRSTSPNCTYTVAKNGTYEFIVYNNNGNYRKATITVNSITTSSVPKVSCSISNSTGNSVITITASSSSGISYYTYSGTKYTTNQISLPRKIPSGSKIIVSATDNNGKSGSATCVSP